MQSNASYLRLKMVEKHILFECKVLVFNTIKTAVQIKFEHCNQFRFKAKIVFYKMRYNTLPCHQCNPS